MPHAHLWPAIIGAALGLAAIGWASWKLARGWEAMTPRRRWWIGGGLALFEIVYWANVYAWLIEPNMLNVRRVEIVSEQWQGAPLTFALVSDTHVGSPHVDSARMGRIVRRVNAEAPDLVLLAGDYAGSHEPEAERTGLQRSEVLGGVATFAALTAPLGVVGVIGNHDSWYGRESITTALQDAGVAALWNRNVTISRPEGAGDVVIAGLADADTGEPSFADALDGAPESADVIVLSHSPDPFADMPDGPALMVAGHGHCGQVTIPLIGRPITPLRNPRYACHLIEENGHTLYVTAGIGTSILPVRFLNPPEIVIITIRGETEASAVAGAGALITREEERELERRASSGDAEAAFRLGDYYSSDPRQQAKSRAWLTYAAHREHGMATQHLVGLLFAIGACDEAVQWLEQLDARTTVDAERRTLGLDAMMRNRMSDYQSCRSA